jgi:hypothetical protein
MTASTVLAGVPWPLCTFRLHWQRRSKNFQSYNHTLAENQQLTILELRLYYLHICYSNLLVRILVSGDWNSFYSGVSSPTSPHFDGIRVVQLSIAMSPMTQNAPMTARELLVVLSYVFWHGLDGYFLHWHVKFLVIFCRVNLSS